MNPKPSILLVDDAPENLDFLNGLLREQYTIKAANNGEIALRIAASRPDLILLDVQMPGIDGLEVCRRLKAADATRDIPVIFVTGSDDEATISQGFAIGGVDYVTKPYNPRELQARIKTHLELKSSRERLAELAANLGKYLSPELYRSIFSGETRVAIGSSRKILTVFFSDIVQFTPRVEAGSHEEVSAWLNAYLNRMAGICARHGGTLDKYIGDAVMVFFGDPSTQGPAEDAKRCISMAREMVEAAKDMKTDIRIGISTGECTVGNFGSENHMAYSILGKEVNVAARLEARSEPNRILISENTHGLVKDFFPSSPHETLMVKGIDRPIATWWVH